MGNTPEQAIIALPPQDHGPWPKEEVLKQAEPQAQNAKAEHLLKVRKASQTFQDGIIRDRLPAWLLAAPAEKMPDIASALAASLATRQQLSAVLEQIKSIDDFVASALQAKLKKDYSLLANVRRMRFVQGRRESVINIEPVGAHLKEVVYEDKPLLEVVLRNFTADEAVEGGQLKGNRVLLPHEGDAARPSAVQLAKTCRQLDLGAQYQRHLNDVLGSADDATQVQSLMVTAARNDMLVEAYKAWQQKQLSDSELKLIKAMCTDGKLVRLAGDLVSAKQLSLLNCNLQQIVVLEVVDQGVVYNSTVRLLLYVPGDPVAAWEGFTDMNAMNRALGNRLRSKPYQRFFSRFVRQRDSQAFFSTVIPAFADLAAWANYNLTPHLRDYSQPLFNTLAKARIRQIKDDAAMIVVPVADIDREVQRAHDQRLAAQGWTLLNVAGLFVPSIGLGLLAITVWELLREVYLGFEAWQEGDTREALAHLTNVATDIVLFGAVAGGVTVTRRLWARSQVVDALIPAKLGEDTIKLWQQDLAPYRSAAPGAAATSDPLGIRRVEEQAWVEMDGHHYPVIEADEGQWRLRPRSGYGPTLHSNGRGAWRLWSEQPIDWQSPHYLMRRFGEPLSVLSDEQIDEVLACHGVGSDQLRALHVCGRAVLPDLLDSAERSMLDRRIRSMINLLLEGKPVDDAQVLQLAKQLPGAAQLPDQALAELASAQRRVLFGQLYEALQPSDTPASQLLRRVFPGLNVRAAQRLLDDASLQDRRRLLQSGRVPLPLAEAARTSLLRIRQARVFEALHFDTPQNADLARVAIGLLRYLPGAEGGVRWRLHEGSVHGPLLMSTEQGVQDFELIHHAGSFQLLDAHGVQRVAAGELFDVLAAAYTPSQQAAMQVADPFAHNLRVLITREARQRRGEVEQLLSPRRPGTFRAPQRMADGRLGYTLGGCSSGGLGRGDRSLAAMLRDLYPAFSDAQVAAWLDAAQRDGYQVEHRLRYLREELTVLTNTLNTWVGEVDGEITGERASVRQTLIDCWRRISVEATEDTENGFRLMLCNYLPGELPHLPEQVSFSHVSELILTHMGLEEVPTSFLLAFSRLRALDLGGNLLTRVPPPLLQMQTLRHLSLTNNRIVLNMADAAILAGCEMLTLLDLSHNALSRAFTLHGLTHLRWLNLRDTALRMFPHSVFERHDLVYLDFRDNLISQIPQAYFDLPLMNRLRFRLGGNPWGPTSRVRLHESLMAAVLPEDMELAELQFANARELWGDAIGPRYRGQLQSAWDIAETGEPTNRLYRVLHQLVLSVDFQTAPRALAFRVLALLRAMNADSALREELLNVSNDEWGCQDGAAWCLSNLEVSILVWRARTQLQHSQEQALLTLGRRLWRLDEVDRIAIQDIVSRGGNPDQSEVGLAYRLGLRDRLGLPIEVGDMNFQPLSGVGEPQLARALAQVLEAETQEALARSLVERTFWQEHLERIHPEQFFEVDMPFQSRLSAVLENEALTDEARRTQSDALQAERRAARRGLMLDMTLRALDFGPQDPPINVR
ncbi:NEL-type E3 ubiquitin ligase domain-containing protein [Pseudomonas sp. Teo4]|uniref:NEL-type E3 ubiquitin ligase domain-containing protein n=1 Tax=Pseudomonas sp. Teo4 TaxID=3064528 RepID=UPI002AB92658|nr:NEL-type E3 ubiquitin ligase domain-containing protein [Pseudomonas sp. Teo4]MDZ3991322.1 hypothetical protein [Pseudomonas sp. Teo4]